MDSSYLLQHLREGSLEEGQTYILAQLADLTDYDRIGNMLADEALAQLFNPFLSLKLAELLIFFGEKTAHTSSHALGLKAKGDALVQIRHHQAALECLDAAGAEFLQLGDEDNWARSRLSWMIAATSRGHVEEALQEAERARQVFLQRGENYWVCAVDHNTAWVLKQVGRYREAGVLYERILTIYPTLTDQSATFIQRAIAMAKVSQALNLSWLGEFEKAYQLELEAQASFAELQEIGMVANSEINLANLEYTLGYFGSALRRYYQAREILLQHAIDIPKTMGEIKLQMAQTLVKLNRAEEACQLASEAVEIYRQFGSSLQTSNTLLEYASALVASGRLKEALAALDEAGILFDHGGFTHYASATRLQQAEILLAMGAAAEAYEKAFHIRQYFETQGLAARAVRASMLIANALYEQALQASINKQQTRYNALLEEAMQLCKRVALQSRQLRLQEEVYKSQYLIGKLFALQGNVQKAKRHYGAAIAQIERILDDLLYDLSPPFLHATWAVYEDMIALCLEQGYSDQAFSYLERARSMALRHYLNTAKTALHEKREAADGLSSLAARANTVAILQIRGELKIWQDRYRDYSTLLTHVDTSVSPVVEQEVIQAELHRCETKIGELFERLYLQQSTSRFTTRLQKGDTIPTAKVGSPFTDITQLQQCLLPDQLLLAYFLNKGRLIIFVITRDHLVTVENATGGKQLQRLLPLLHAHLQAGGWPDPQHPPQEGIRLLLKKLFDLLIAPVTTFLSPTTNYLTIVPYGPLHTLPFHALYDGNHFLIENFQVNYLPTASLLARFAHSDYRQQEEAAHEADSEKRPLLFGYSGHGSLQHALEEAQTVATLLDGRVYLEEAATITRLIEEAPGSPIIHLATHGYSRLDAPNFSSVLLADGRFNAIDAFSLNLNKCELVTLSGCETGLALSSGGDEQLGLGRAFLAAGATTLVMSLWSVEDNATNELMQLFYQNLLRGDSKVQALQAAQRALIQRTPSSYSHPFYWAAFRLVGDIAPLSYRLQAKRQKIALHQPGS